jgi:hypothetical protein
MENDRDREHEETWGESLRHHTVWFFLAVIIGLGSSYIAVEINIATLQSNVAVAQDHIDKLQARADSREKKDSQLEVQLARLEEKLDLLLRLNGLERQDENQ